MTLSADQMRKAPFPWFTASENIRHSYANDRPRPWSKATATVWRGRPVIDEHTKTEIRKERANGALLREIAARYGISTSHVHRIVGSGTEVE